MIVKPSIGLMAFAVGLSALASSAPAMAADAVRGGKLFLQCAACHGVAPGGAHSVGPNLAGIVGAAAATRPGYTYSQALAKSGLTWDAASLDIFLKRPTQAVPGTKMAFAGVADPKARADLIAYLATLKPKK